MRALLDDRIDDDLGFFVGRLLLRLCGIVALVRLARLYVRNFLLNAGGFRLNCRRARWLLDLAASFCKENFINVYPVGLSRLRIQCRMLRVSYANESRR